MIIKGNNIDTVDLQKKKKKPHRDSPTSWRITYFRLDYACIIVFQSFNVLLIPH